MRDISAMENKWMLRAVFVLAVCLTRNLTSGFRNESFEVGSRVTLLCTNTKIAWSEMIYVIWKISTQEKNCSIAVARNDSNFDTCQDGKKINISKGGDYSLIIPHFSIKDEGNYTCDVSYHAGGYVENIYVSAWVQPKMAGWLETKGGHTFAICEVQSLPEASILWEPLSNSSLPETNSSREASGIFIVTSRLQLPRNAFDKNLTCVAASHSKWPETRFTIFTGNDNPVKWPFILLGVCATCSIVTLLTGLYIMREKLGRLSVFKKICCSSQISQPSKEEKTPQPRDTEEVEPYASYVQRVNSIYNSSADLFNA
ncbi:cell surface glycoprotein CD200 receptor 1-B-like isoform X2 [Colossoma macropomum]|uniref:cell surface glycoprotein CD200 receptor 1-B-like isoform X2 n=1 Tax=Colossoma macropomum TaxID=42526 RepID=UPI001864A07B|nr:cell surface glycoprotein CD200 receptor 1-B-like isoform X2 [Colossoma macropomum]